MQQAVKTGNAERRLGLAEVHGWLVADGMVEASLPWPGLDPRVLALAPAGGACLRFVDARGRTVFNRLQVPALFEELRYARVVAPEAEVGQNAESLLRFLALPARETCDLWIEPVPEDVC